jgi:hypothetical protein
MGKKSAGACRATAAGADVSPDAGHRGHVFPRRPHRDENDQGEHERRKHRQYRQHRQCCPLSWVAGRSSQPCQGQRINIGRADDADGADAGLRSDANLASLDLRIEQVPQLVGHCRLRKTKGGILRFGGDGGRHPVAAMQPFAVPAKKIRGDGNQGPARAAEDA